MWVCVSNACWSCNTEDETCKMEGIRRRSLVRRAADDAVKSFYQHPLLLFPVVAVLFALGCAVAVVCVSVGVWTILQWIYGAWPSVALPQPVLDSFDSVSALLARVGVPQLLVNFWSVLRTCCQVCVCVRARGFCVCVGVSACFVCFSV